MEKTVDELKKIIVFKDTTEVGDVILMINEPVDENSPFGLAYAVVTDFVRDNSKRDEWWHVHLSFLTVPPQPQVLILQAAHFTGQEIFTMGGKKVFIKALNFAAKPGTPTDDKKTPKTRGGLKVIK
jgi:hypothetical protein